MTLGLPECLELALQRQPRIAVQRASLAAAEDGSRSVENLKVPVILSPELPVRRRQACLGVTAAAAGLDQVERETVYAVTRTYVTVLYAREQERVARGIVDRLTTTRNAAKQQLDAGARDVSASDVNRASVYIRLAQAKNTQASQGVRRALAALKEAIGLSQDDVLDVPTDRLAEPKARPNREEIMAAALARRGEIIRTSIFEQVACLEVEAQASNHHKRVETFAAGSDIHSVIVPEGSHNTEYRPGGVPPEMPTLLAGERPDRVQHAQDLHTRAAAALEATRNLIGLEAQDAFIRWQEASREARETREAADTADKLAEDVNKDFTSGLKVKVEDVVNARVLASTARSQYNEYLYREILALIDLERISAGAFSAGLAKP
jgi:outer membrane protein TolC